ncbi:MAG: hypothetical protein AAGA48_37765 [Myxococcota bacterium]
MSLRLAPASSDLILAHWAGITTRVAWTLLRLGVQPRPDVFHEARLDAVLRLSATDDPSLLEDKAEGFTEAWVARIRGKPAPLWPGDWDVPVTPENVPIRQDDPDLLVLQRHYGDHRRLVDLVKAHGITLDTLEAAQHRLRLAAMTMLGDPQAPLGRVERVLRRLAAYAPEPCPPVSALRVKIHRAHVTGCPRCDRTLRLISRQVLPAETFDTPATLPAPQVDLAVIQLREPAVRERPVLLQHLAMAAPLGHDALVTSAHDPDGLMAALNAVTQDGRIAARQMRVLRRQGTGALSVRGVAGPLMDDLEADLTKVAWGDWTGAPRNPRAESLRHVAFGMAAVFGLAFLPLAWRLAMPPVLDPTAPDVSISTSESGAIATFDVPEDAWVSVFALRNGRLHVLKAASSPADKAAWATGDGRYELSTSDSGLLLAIHEGPLLGLSDALALAQASPAPLPTLAARLDRQATVRWSEPDAR